jgi:Tfp pilus assembly protein PilN
MRAVNLLPRDEKQPRLEGARIPLLLAAGGVAAVTAGAVVLAFSASGTADERRAELATIEATIAQLPKPPDQGVDQSVLVQERTQRVAALSAALTTRFSFDRLLREISFVLPRNAWLTGLKAAIPVTSAETATPTPGSTSSSESQDVSIEGATYSHDAIAVILARLSVLPSLENVRLTASARVVPQPTQTTPTETTSKKSKKSKKAKKVKKKVIVTFTIAASLRPGGS